ncbi:cell wall hydrolase [Aneurinibacillus aneurinilyticus]|uniref:cell wall hydrolase n=1 Tax=Aneurinibacillus aneurinilyticus TaxID=1391 RepID=UPI002E24DC61|nr:cell wall hydrolase [Aneurinibacillus aneurinilyticus]MED0668641.1 cell wall hydrolase [Aneurinibacillus aneurinilyticus]
MKKTAMTIVLTTFLLGAAGAQPSEAASIPVPVNGKAVYTNSFIQNDYMMVPAEFFMNAGVQVGWNENYHSVTLKKGDMIIGLPSGKNYADIYTNQSGTWKREYLKTTTTDRKEGTYIPLRYAAEKLGFTLSGNSPATVALSTQQAASKLSAQSKDTENSGYKQEELYWLYQLTEAEAGGEPYEGKIAVAASVLNRVHSPEWPNTLKAVIFQVDTFNGKRYHQYSPVLDKRIYNVQPSKETIAAVQEALHGKDPSQSALVFYNPDKTDNQWVRSRPVTVKIGSHVFSK